MRRSKQREEGGEKRLKMDGGCGCRGERKDCRCRNSVRYGFHHHHRILLLYSHTISLSYSSLYLLFYVYRFRSIVNNPRNSSNSCIFHARVLTAFDSLANDEGPLSVGSNLQGALTSRNPRSLFISSFNLLSPARRPEVADSLRRGRNKWRMSLTRNCGLS